MVDKFPAFDVGKLVASAGLNTITALTYSIASKLEVLLRQFFAHLRIQRPLSVVDVETTSLSPAAARIVEIAALRIVPEERPRLFRTRVNPGEPIPSAATAVHNITDADVVRKPHFAAIAQPLAEFLDGSDLAGFNLANYDLPILAREFARAKVPFRLEGRAILDAYTVFVRREPRDLRSALRFYTGRTHRRAHSATADVWATARILDAQLARYSDLPRDPDALHRVWIEVDIGRRFRRGIAGEILLGFGRYGGQPLAEVARCDPGYLRWLLTIDLLEDARTLVCRALEGDPLIPECAEQTK